MHPLLGRRGALMASAAGLAATVWAAPRRASAQAPAPPGPFTLPPLPYAADANEPHIDAQTMTIHHDRHHAAYVNNLNMAARDNPAWAKLPPGELVAKLAELPDDVRTLVRNNGGGHVNHTMFWHVMGGRGGAPTGALAQAIDRDFGGIDKLKGEFNGAGARVFGSGWVFVTVAGDGKLALASRPNQDTPLMDGQKVLLGNDVWEHAYYLKYQNRRPDYLAAWWNVVDWGRVAERFAAARAGTLKL